MLKLSRYSLYDFAARSGKLGFFEKQEWEMRQPLYSIFHNSLWNQVSNVLEREYKVV